MTTRKSIKIPGETKLKELEALLKKYRKRGYKPYLKGKGSGYVKIQFE